MTLSPAGPQTSGRPASGSDGDCGPGRPLGLIDLTCLGLNAIVGSSIFLFPGRMAQLLGPASILAFGLTGLLLLPVGLCFASAARNFERPGGPYLYARAAFGEWPGFAIGWMCWVTQIFSCAAVSNAIAAYLGHFAGVWTQAWVVKGTALGAIAAFAALNYAGVRLGAWACDLFTAAKLIPLLLFAGIGLAYAEPSRLVPFAPHGWSPLGPACFLAYFAFSGFEVVPVPAGEARRPRTNVPVAITCSMILAALLYMLVQGVAVGTNPGLAGSSRPLAESAALFLGPAGAAMIVAGAVVSTAGFTAGSVLGGPRYLLALAQDRHLPPALAAIHPKFGTPHRAIILTAGLSALLAIVLDFDKLVDFSNVVVCAQYIATCAAAPLLAARRPGRPAGGRLSKARAWGIAVAGIASTIWLGAQGRLSETAWSAAILASGCALRLAWLRLSRS